MDKITWQCQICKKLRPDKKISVLSYPEKNWPTTTINTKYCNDNPLCYKGALRKQETERNMSKYKITWLELIIAVVLTGIMLSVMIGFIVMVINAYKLLKGV